ncbi:MAG: hypothetical protein ACOZF2_11710 [Thermodesulfobacteriota bacterium]
MDEKRFLQRFGTWVGYTDADMEQIPAGDPRVGKVAAGLAVETKIPLNLPLRKGDF